jgi:AcrR family transcriptional regulator
MTSRSSRPYRKRKRAESEEETRRRITEAAVELHGTVGPANTKMTEVAERAGVSRATLYNHFPSQVDLFMACSSHWAARHPFPDPSGWAAISDPSLRLGEAMRELYRWYGENAGMMGAVLRDAAVLPDLAEVMDELWESYLERAVDALAKGWATEHDDSRALDVVLRLVVDFHTWELLTGAGLDDDGAAELSVRLVVAEEPRRRSR